MFLNRAMRFLMNADGGNGAGGGGAGEGTPPPAPAPAEGDRWAKLEQMMGTIAQQQAAHSRIFAQLAEAPEPQQKEPEIDETDPMAKLERRIQQMEQQATQRIMSVQERQDMVEFRRLAVEQNLDAETMKLTDQVYAHWKKSGFKTMDGTAPTRQDALRYARGVMAEQAGPRNRQVQAEIDDENSDAFTGTGSRLAPVGGAPRAGVPSNFETLPREERMKQYASILDKQGGW